MTNIHLVTGFLGVGKTTFLNNLIPYYLNQNKKVAILENDFGAVNVDVMLFDNLISKGVLVESVAGGCDKFTHQRRFRTKLLSICLQGYDEVFIEPSGVFDLDELFDSLYDEPLNDLCQLKNIYGLACPDILNNLTDKSKYILMSELANCKKIVITKCDFFSLEDVKDTKKYINEIMVSYDQKPFKDDDFILLNNTINDDSYSNISSIGYKGADYIKKNYVWDDSFNSVYLLDLNLQYEQMIENIKNVLAKEKNVSRIKGFVYKDEQCYMVNCTKNKLQIEKTSIGQNVLIIIGEALDTNSIRNYFN